MPGSALNSTWTAAFSDWTQSTTTMLPIVSWRRADTSTAPSGGCWGSGTGAAQEAKRTMITPSKVPRPRRLSMWGGRGADGGGTALGVEVHGAAAHAEQMRTGRDAEPGRLTPE